MLDKMLDKILRIHNTKINKIEASYEDRLTDKDKIIKLQEDKIASLEKIEKISKLFNEIEYLQNEKIEKIKKERGFKNGNKKCKYN